MLIYQRWFNVITFVLIIILQNRPLITAEDIISKESNGPTEEQNCRKDDVACLTMVAQDRMSWDAITALHQQLDDDADGAIDLAESQDFLKEELKYENGADKRQKIFHQNNDMFISVKELWDAWRKSEVHNWTVEQTIEWLATTVELPQYVPVFITNSVTGACLPRLAAGNGQFISNQLKIKDPIHKQKIMLKAMDVVLFGPPKIDITHRIKDWVLVSLLVGVLSGCYYFYQQKKRSAQHLTRMIKDMESLQKAEQNLENLQKELERAKQEQESVQSEKLNLEKKLQEQTTDGLAASNSSADLEVAKLKNEIEVLRNALQRAEGELVDRYWSPPPTLQLWLQLTHEIENKSYGSKKASAERQLQVAREACEKLNKKRSSLIGAFVSTHGKSIDEVDRSIVDARTALNEVTQELAEKVYRWKQIENLLGFNIINNKGLAYLEGMLYSNAVNGRNLGFRCRGSSNQDSSVDDDTLSMYSASAGQSVGQIERGNALESLNKWLDSHDATCDVNTSPEDDDLSVHFTLGPYEGDDVRRRLPLSFKSSGKDTDKERPQPVVQSSKSNRLVKSVSEDKCNSVISDADVAQSKPVRNLQPAKSFDMGDATSNEQPVTRPPRKAELTHSASVGGEMDDESSSHSSSTTIEENKNGAAKQTKTKSRVLRFPKFSRKTPKKPTTPIT